MQISWVHELLHSWPEIDSKMELHGYPIFTTTQIPNNLGGGGDETEITFADFDEVVIGDTMRIEISISTEASIKDGGGNVVSLFQTDQTAIRAISEHDLVPRHDSAIAVINGVTWALG